MSIDRTSILTNNLEFPESPRWHGGKLWFCDYGMHKVMSVDSECNVKTVAEPPDLPTAVSWTPDGQLLVVSANERRLLKLQNGELVMFADLSDLVTHACGDMVIDAHGNAYVANLGFDFGSAPPSPASGFLLHVTASGEAEVAASEMAFPNGMVITPDGGTLIVAESFAARLTAFDIGADGSLTDRRVWAQFDDSLPFGQGRFTPDGMSLDAEGAVWVSSQKEVLRIREGGEVLEKIVLERYSTACMLGGEDRRTLFLCTTNVTNPVEEGARGRIETVDVSVPGVGLP